PLPGDHREAWNVVDRLFRVEFGALAAWPVEDVDDVALEVEQAELEHGKEAHGPCPDDDDVRCDLFLCHSLVQRHDLVVRQAHHEVYWGAGVRRPSSRIRLRMKAGRTACGRPREGYAFS